MWIEIMWGLVGVICAGLLIWAIVAVLEAVFGDDDDFDGYGY